MKTGRIKPAAAAALWQRFSPGQPEPERYGLAARRQIVAALAKRPVSEREEIMPCLPPVDADYPAELLDDAALATLVRSGVAISSGWYYSIIC